MSRPNGKGEPRHPLGGDLVIPLLAAAFTLYYFVTIIASPWTAQVSAFFVGTILLLLIAVFVAKTIRAVRACEGEWALGELVSPVSLVPRRFGLLGLTVAYIVVLQWAGFTLTTFVFLYLAMRLLGPGKPKRAALLSALAFSLGGYLLFVAAFQTRFPEGPFERLMQGLF